MNDLTNQELEIKIGFLERHVEEQDKVILAMRKELGELRREIKRLEGKFGSIQSDNGELKTDEKPPHY